MLGDTLAAIAAEKAGILKRRRARGDAARCRPRRSRWSSGAPRELGCPLARVNREIEVAAEVARLTSRACAMPKVTCAFAVAELGVTRPATRRSPVAPRGAYSGSLDHARSRRSRARGSSRRSCPRASRSSHARPGSSWTSRTQAPRARARGGAAAAPRRRSTSCCRSPRASDTRRAILAQALLRRSRAQLTRHARGAGALARSARDRGGRARVAARTSRCASCRAPALCAGGAPQARGAARRVRCSARPARSTSRAIAGGACSSCTRSALTRAPRRHGLRNERPGRHLASLQRGEGLPVRAQRTFDCVPCQSKRCASARSPAASRAAPRPRSPARFAARPAQCVSAFSGRARRSDTTRVTARRRAERCRGLVAWRTSATSAARCAGVVPQQPPSTRAPRAAASLAASSARRSRRRSSLARAAPEAESRRRARRGLG